MRPKAWIALIALALSLAACVPAAQPDPDPVVVVINGPDGARVDGTADAFVSQIRTIGTPGFSVLRDVAIEGVELRRNLGGSQAVPSAARIARSFGGEYTLMLGAVDVNRDVVEGIAGQVKILIDLSVEGVLVRADDERVIARITSRTFRGERRAAATEPLPELSRDPLTVELAERASASLASVYREIITGRISGSSSE